jgi:neutral amino acid transport system permease protein
MAAGGGVAVDADTFWLLTSFGLVSGGFLALASVGMSMLVGVTGFLNFAYGEWLTLAGFFAFSLNVTLHAGLWLSVAAAVLLVTVTGTLVARLAFEPIARRGAMTLLVTSMGVSFVLQNVVVMVWGSDVRRLEVPVSLLTAHEVGPLRMTTLSIATVATALAAMVVVAVVLKRTAFGREMRAVADDAELARAAGIDMDRVRRRAWVVGSAVAGLAGVMLALTSPITPTMGFDQMLVIASAVIVGGLGSVYGAACAALLLGYAMSLSTAWITPSLKAGVAFAVLVLVLLLRPQGLFGQRRAVR